jgi:hypothetical protein
VIDLAPRARAGELSHESVIEQPLRQALRSRTKDDSGRRIAQLETEVGHMVAAIGEGICRLPSVSGCRRPSQS